MNKIILNGRWMRDIKLDYVKSGQALATGTIVVPRKFNKDEIDTFQVVLWGKIAENTAKYCGTQGSQILLTGRLQANKYEKDGETRYGVQVIAEDIEFIQAKKSDAFKGAVDEEKLDELNNIDNTPDIDFNDNTDEDDIGDPFESIG